MKILIIEDDQDIAELLEYNLRQEGYEVLHHMSGLQGLEAVQQFQPDLIILDLMLPDLGGLDVCKNLKSDTQTQSIPVLMLTAKGEEIDRVVGFEVGADDYLTKPFSTRELILRVKAILKRMRMEPDSMSTQSFSFGVLHIDPEKFIVTVADESIRLTPLEFKLLQYLCERQGRIATRDNLLDNVWGYEAALMTRTVDAHIKRLREKLGEAGAYIETVRGMGYRFKEVMA